MYQWRIFYEPSDEERVFLGVIFAATMAEALNRAAQFFEYPVHDLVAEQVA